MAIDLFTIYNCKRELNQKSTAQLVMLNDREDIIVKYIDGLFIYCKLEEAHPLLSFNIIERVDSLEERRLAEVETREGIYRVPFNSVITLYLIIFKDFSSVVYVPDDSSVVFWKRAGEMLNHIAKTSLLWLPPA